MKRMYCFEVGSPPERKKKKKEQIFIFNFYYQSNSFENYE